MKKMASDHHLFVTGQAIKPGTYLLHFMLGCRKGECSHALLRLLASKYLILLLLVISYTLALHLKPELELRTMATRSTSFSTFYQTYLGKLANNTTSWQHSQTEMLPSSSQLN